MKLCARVARLTAMICTITWIFSLVMSVHIVNNSEALAAAVAADGTPAYERRNMKNDAGAVPVAVKKRRRVVEISGPAELNQPDTEYILTRDVVAEGTAFTIKASYITLNLNSHTVTYDTRELGKGPKGAFGITISEFNLKDIAIVNGVIKQGAANGSGQAGGLGHNPVFAQGPEHLELAGLSITYGGKDISGLYVNYGSKIHIHHNTINDTGTIISNRHQGLDAVLIEHADADIHNNLVTRCRHRAFTFGSHSKAYNNDITIDSYATNAYGFMCFKSTGFQSTTTESSAAESTPWASVS